MQALLSYDQSPPLAAPFRFFLTAPLFSLLAGVLLLWSGPDIFLSRWTPAALALTHLITVGFMMQVMLGAMVQILPVIAGANMVGPLWVSRVVHALLNLGVIFLIVGFMSFYPLMFQCAVVLLGAGVAVFVYSATRALYGIRATSPTIQGLKHALIGLSVTAGLGLALSISFGWSLNLPLLQLADIHLVWGFAGWGMVLLAAVAFVVVPMFQLTPPYSDDFGRWFTLSVLLLLALWTLADFTVQGFVSTLAALAIVLMTAYFAALTLDIQRRSKRPNFDATQHYWRGGMFSVLAACIVWLLAQHVASVAEWQGWPLLFGILLMFCGFMSVIVGMLYKIFPFLIWLHLQNLGQGRMMSPNMKKIIAEPAMVRQMKAHFISCALLLLVVVWPDWFVYPAGTALIVSSALLLRNMLTAMSVYRAHVAKIQSMSSAA